MRRWFWRRQHERALDELTQAAMNEFGSLMRVTPDDPVTLERSDTEMRRTIDAYEQVVGPVVEGCIAKLKHTETTPEEAYKLVMANEDGDRVLAGRVQDQLFAARLADLDDDALLQLADELEQRKPNKAKFRAVDAERSRRGLLPPPLLEIPLDERDPSWTDERARYVAASKRYWKLNHRVSRGLADQADLDEWTRLEIEVARASEAMDAVETSQT